MCIKAGEMLCDGECRCFSYLFVEKLQNARVYCFVRRAVVGIQPFFSPGSSLCLEANTRCMLSRIRHRYIGIFLSCI